MMRMNDNKLCPDDFEKINDILCDCMLGDVISTFTDVYLLLKPYHIDKRTFKEAFDEVIITTIQDCDESHIDWWHCFDFNELLEELIVYRAKIDPYHFVELFNKHTDYSTTEIDNFINTHCELFDENPDDYTKYL